MTKIEISEEDRTLLSRVKTALGNLPSKDVEELLWMLELAAVVKMQVVARRKSDD